MWKLTIIGADLNAMNSFFSASFTHITKNFWGEQHETVMLKYVYAAITSGNSVLSVEPLEED